MIIISVILSCTIIWYLYYYIVHLARYRKLLNLMPGPSQIPIIGDPIIFTRPNREQIFAEVYSRFAKYGTFHKARCFLWSIVCINHPNDVQVIMNSTKYNSKGKFYKFLHPWLNDGLLLSKGEKWQERRKILTPAFHFNILKPFCNVLIEESNHMAKSMRDMNSTCIDDLVFFISHHTLNIICETSMGISLQNISKLEQKKYREAVHNMGELLCYRFSRPWIFHDVLYKLSSAHRKQAECLKILHGFTEKIIKGRKQYHQATGGRYLNFDNNAENDEQSTYSGEKKRLALLDILIRASMENQLSDLDIREEVDTFMFEGHDTVAMAITFSILLLAEHKDAQDRVRNEVNAAMEENGGKLTMAALQNLSYTERCVKEAIRLYPSVFFILRQINEEVKLQYDVPAGVELYIDIRTLHRNPDFWSNPDVFDPDRFLPEATQRRHPFAYIPFSAGSRNCIGQRFAMMELKTVIGTLVHNFHFEPVGSLKDMKLHSDIILRPSHPLRVKFIPI